MTVPSEALRVLAHSVLLGAALGVLYSFLRPLRPKHTLLADSLFVLAALWAFVYLGFGICGGDIRLGGMLGELVGAITAERTLGRWLGPVFRIFWRGAARLRRMLLAPAKKFFEFLKILFASGEKWVTIR